ncbi:MAG: ABC transporter substrate-binding protein [Calditrichaeota bacterium]|nr:ABC transporter substrate-binding protein [Calditrichota bacterium]
MKRVISALIFIFLLHSSFNAFAVPNHQLQAQVNPEVEKAYQKGLQLFKSGRYDVAAWELQNMLILFPKNHRKSSALYLIARARFHEKKYAEANEALKQLLQEFPKSKYRYDALFLEAAIAYQQNNIPKTLELLQKIIDDSKNKTLVQQSEKIAYKIVVSHYALSDISDLKNQYSSSNLKPVWMLAEASKLIAVGDYQQAKKKTESFLKAFPNSPLRTEALALKKILAESPTLALKIGVILPLTGFYSEQARDVANGIQMAYDTWKNSHARTNIHLEIFDSRGNIVEALKTTQRLVASKKTLALLGSLESNPTAAIAAVSSYGPIPMLAPTGTENGIADLGENVFQMDGNIDIRGKILAEYAIQKLHLKTFAILAPADEYGKQITDSFAATIDQLGGKILAETWYYEGAMDFKKQLSHIRNVGLEKMVWDSLRAAYPNYADPQIDSLFAIEKVIRREKNQNRVIKKLADSTAVPVTSIDGIFLPVYTEDIKYIAPQYAMFNIQSQILGGDYWKDINILNDNNRYINGVIFTTDVYVNENDLPYLRFKNQYRMTFKSSPSKFSILGYDTMRFLLKVIGAGNYTTADVLKALKKTDTFEGLHGTFKFSNGSRVNSGMVLLRYENGAFRRVN